jgi:hypothetical protein
VSFQQLYFTNCEQGLSGYAGFQFNAVTDGTSGETMRAVESLTSYQPPPSTAYASTPEELDRCPVNLCYAPGDTTIVASVRYVGRDSSLRFGNYFAHALASGDLDSDDADLLPIELWRAPLWNCLPAPDTSLPTLEGPLGTGPLSRDQVAGFLDAHPHRARLASLLSAAGLAQGRADRSVLVVAESADEVATWFAAVSYLLPPQWVRRLSFSTYLSRPSRSRLHLVGTVPETKLDLGPDADERFYLFDFPGERFPALDEHPLASLCVGIGLVELPALWAWADSLADGKETTLDDWYPVVTAAAALGRASLTEADLDAVITWLGAREDLPEGTQNAIARAVHGHTAIAMGHRRTLLTVADRTGDAGLWEQVQYGLLEPLLLDRTDGATVVTALESSAPSSARVREQLTAKAEEQLRLAEESADALSLLDWAAHAELPIDPDVLAECGRSMVAPLLAAAQPLSPPQRDQATRVASRWPAAREGIVHYLTALADRDPAKAAGVLAGLAGELLTEQDIPAGSAILVPYLAYRGLRRHERPAAILGDLARRGVIAQADDPLLAMLWAARTWSLADAAEVLGMVDPRVLVGALGWFDVALASRPSRETHEAYVGLCRSLMASPLASLFAASERPTLREIADLYRATSEARRVRDLLPVIDARHGRDSAPALVLCREWLAPEVARLPVDKPVELFEALVKLNAPGFMRYLHLIAARFREPDADIAKHAAALWVIAGTKQGIPYEYQLSELLTYAAKKWRPERLQQAVKLAETVEPDSGQEFLDYIDLAHPVRVAKAAKKVRQAGRRLSRVISGGPPKAVGGGTADPER